MTASHKGLLLILSGPSGVGKTTIARAIESRLGARFSVSMTTRTQRPGDAQGVDYRFVDEAEFTRARVAGELLEFAEVFGNWYGTPRAPIEQTLDDGGVMIAEIDVAGAEQIKQQMPDALGIFIMPPDEKDLLKRLRARGRDDEATIERRFSEAKAEINRAQKGDVYEYFVVNDNLDAAVDQAVDLVRTELDRRQSAGT